MTPGADELCWCSAGELAEAIRSRRVSAVEVVDAHLQQIERWNPQIGAVVTLLADAARQAARQATTAVLRGERLGPLHGVPVLVKDAHAVAGVRMSCGSRLLSEHVADADCILVERLRRAGAIVLGKTNMSEFGMIPLTAGSLEGDCRNPWNVRHNAGGSSGGSAAGVACGMAPLATGSDGGGSIRVPAAFCGVFGLKPHFGRVPHVALPRGWENLAHHGPITRTVRDAARLLDCLAGPDARDRWSLPHTGGGFEAACGRDVRGLRLAWSVDLGSLPVAPEVARLVQTAALRFAELGCIVEPVTLDLPDLTPAQQTIVLCEAVAALADRRAEWEQVIYPANQRMFAKADAISTRDLLEAHWAREMYWARLVPLFEQYDALLTPTVPIVAPENGTLGPREIDGRRVRALSWLGHCVPSNMTWQPAASLPAGRTEAGLPVGLQIVGRRFDETTLLALAAAYEEAFPWHTPRPTVVA